jgi:hypothetical protein
VIESGHQGGLGKVVKCTNYLLEIEKEGNGFGSDLRELTQEPKMDCLEEKLMLIVFLKTVKTGNSEWL